MAAEDISAIILAGGRARRFAGQDKGLIALQGRPLVRWAADRLAPQVAEILISANRNLEAYAGLGHPVLADALADFPGPLAGILSAAERSRREWVLTAPCDAPFLPADLASRLLARARACQVPLVRAADQAQVHYAVMLLRRDLLADLADYVAGGGRQVQAWQARHPHADAVFAEGQRAFLNINTPEDLRLAERLATDHEQA
jgi:molybdopterin-guanine dinucleotide biosynthesis protein A